MVDYLNGYCAVKPAELPKQPIRPNRPFAEFAKTGSNRSLTCRSPCEAMNF